MFSLKKFIEEDVIPYNIDFTYFQIVINDVECIKEQLKSLQYFRRKDQQVDRVRICHHIELIVEKIRENYLRFLKNIYNIPRKLKFEDQEKRVEYLLTKKKEINIEFEKIYHYFKNTAKNLKDVPMKIILKQMQIAFDFDSSSFKLAKENFGYYNTNNQKLI